MLACVDRAFTKKESGLEFENGVPRIVESEVTDAENGKVVWAPKKSIWFLSNAITALIGGYFFFSWSALAIFILFTGLTLCLGHSLGLHRRLIHNSYNCPLWLEYVFVHFGVLVGMAGPLGMVHQHDLRDWAQRKRSCHSYLRHGEHFFKDGWWQLNCDLRLDNPPTFNPEDRIKKDAILVFMERTWVLQQLPWVFLFYIIGGLPWVVWGISARITISVLGHWLIGYFAHNQGGRDWHVSGAAVQGYNVPIAAIITMGESWHNNHHAFPGSAILGIYEYQADPGWWVLNVLRNFGLVWDVVLPVDLPVRPELMLIEQNALKSLKFKSPKPCPVLGALDGS